MIDGRGKPKLIRSHTWLPNEEDGAIKTLKKFEFTGGVGMEAIYDWDKLLDGGIYSMESGTDFTCKDATFATLVRNAARKAGKTVQTQKEEKDGKVSIVICATAASKDQIKEWEKQDAERKVKKEAAKALKKAGGGETEDEGEGEVEE